MKKFVCMICNYEHDEASGTKWDDLADNWVCPICGASKDEFNLQGEEESKPRNKQVILETHNDMKELSPLEVSALCDNLARACQKMYAFEQEGKFRELSDYFKAGQAPATDPSYEKLLALIETDLEVLFPNAEQVATDKGDRGALRALTWTLKASRMLKSILSRYEKEGNDMLENTGVYVCTICGYIYIGNELPEVCPVCKVPNWKFNKIEEGAA